ncbi:MAG: cobaltochelatase subunit CobT [Burkholderiales bacterium]|nr:cobaltochelatase subunit CobT [Burkholderiales bacterium]
MSAPKDRNDVAAGHDDERIEAFRRVTAAAMRALAHRPELQLTFLPEAAAVRGSLVHLPPPSTAAPGHARAAVRGEADAISLRLRFHGSALHRQWAPAQAAARAIFDALEQARCEARGALRMHGVARNLAAAIEQRYRATESTAPATVSMAEAVGLVARETFTGQALPDCADRMVEPFRPWIAAKAPDGLARLARLVHDQAAFAALARPLAEDLARGEEELAENAADDDPAGRRRQDPSRRSDGEAEGSDGPGNSAADAGDEAERSVDPRTDGRALAQARTPGRESPGRQPRRSAARYRAFTTEFDEVVEPDALCGAAELTRLRLDLDARLGPFQPAVARLANRLQRKVLARQMRAWERDREEGTLDTARLARVVVDPLYPLSHRHERESAFRDTVVQLLIDNSGSMRGAHIGIAAMSADIIARTLERCDVKVEILGYTTRAWKGGKSRERWLAAGRPSAPGRLNDLRHIVYKAADTPWRRARRGLGLMLRDGLLKENVDGEALLWAHGRLLARAERRRILMVISDGGPVDDSTLAANPGNFLEQHLREVIDAIERRSPVELVAIGIGHDVSRYYRRAVTLVDAGQLGGAMLRELADLFRADTAPAAEKLRRRQLTTQGVGVYFRKT